MTAIYLYTLISVILVSLTSLVCIFFIFLKESFLKKLIFLLIGLSVGSLFGDTFIHLLPQIYAKGNNLSVSFAVLFGILLFFILEKFINWHHSHEEENAVGLHRDCEGGDCHIQPAGYTILFGDTLHNFIDGLIVAASYLISIEVGIATTIAVVLHEIPHEIGDFAVMLHSGFTTKKALFWNVVSSLAAILGAIAGLFLGLKIEGVLPLLIALAAGGFIYIAGSDLVPQLHRDTKIKQSIYQLISILVGVGLMALILLFE